MGFSERGLCLAKGARPVGPELVLKGVLQPSGTWVRGASLSLGFRFPNVAGLSRPGSLP